MSPLHNLILLQPGIIQLVSSAQMRTGPPTKPGFSQGFFLHFVTDGVLVPCRCRQQYRRLDCTNTIRTELDDNITEFNYELPLNEH